MCLGTGELRVLSAAWQTIDRDSASPTVGTSDTLEDAIGRMGKASGVGGSAFLTSHFSRSNSSRSGDREVTEASSSPGQLSGRRLSKYGVTR